MALARPTILLASLAVCGCALFPPRLGPGSPAAVDAGPAPSVSEVQADAGAPDAASEEESMEDGQALADLIALHLRVQDVPSAPRPAAPEPTGDWRAPAAYANSQLTPAQCLARLDELGVEVERPAFDTPGVETPLLLAGDVDGVVVRPRWARPKPENSVMDCHLVLAVYGLAERARELGVAEILYYSTYRAPRATGGPHRQSQHTLGLAIDVGWLVTRDGRTIEVLRDYERRDGAPPCEQDARTAEGLLLRDLACGLYRDAVFNVILTPNANKAHHNHFHLDVTRGAKWHIVR
jgi:hypothetical protein